MYFMIYFKLTLLFTLLCACITILLVLLVVYDRDRGRISALDVQEDLVSGAGLSGTYYQRCFGHNVKRCRNETCVRECTTGGNHLSDTAQSIACTTPLHLAIYLN